MARLVRYAANGRSETIPQAQRPTIATTMPVMKTMFRMIMMAGIRAPLSLLGYRSTLSLPRSRKLNVGAV
jgi:hypothetical protein